MNVITVKGTESDYAIMKQVQQLRLMDKTMAVATLGASTDFSKLAADETLYLVSHGDQGSGDLRGVDRADLLGWLKDKDRGVPPKFGGIVILSCYSGVPPAKLTSLAAYLAEGLAGRAAAGTTVAGVNGYSYGTPEFRKTKRSSVLPMKLSHFYTYSAPYFMTNQWLEHHPTHAGGVLKEKLNITVDEGKTITENLAAFKQPQKIPRDIATECINDFIPQAKAIEQELTDIITAKIQGSSVSQRAEYLVNNGADQNVIAWNTAIEKQYKLFGDFYLWACPADAFTAKLVP